MKRQKRCVKPLFCFALMLGAAFFAYAEGLSKTSEWIWNVTVEDPQGRMGATASVYLLTDDVVSLESLERSVTNGSFNAQIALRRFSLKLGKQDVKFNVPYEVATFNRHGIYALFSEADPSKSKYYSVGYFSAFRGGGLAFPPPGYYFDSDGKVVPCHCNMSTISFANAKRLGGNATP